MVARPDVCEMEVHGGTEDCSFVDCKELPELVVLYTEDTKMEFFCPGCFDKPETQSELGDHCEVYTIYKVGEKS